MLSLHLDYSVVNYLITVMCTTDSVFHWVSHAGCQITDPNAVTMYM